MWCSTGGHHASRQVRHGVKLVNGRTVTPRGSSESVEDSAEIRLDSVAKRKGSTCCTGYLSEPSTEEPRQKQESFQVEKLS